MKVIHFGHSGVWVEGEEHVLIFDFYQGSLPKFPKGKKVYVFSSHVHYDHFNPVMFQWKKEVPDITYILSDDILAKAEKEEVSFKEEIEEGGKIFISYRQELDLDDLKIKTLRSTDEGVAFLVQMEGKTIYHAGDLHWWHWKEESDLFNAYMKTRYQRELNCLKGREIDLAFLPADPRQEEAYVWGMEYFLRHISTKRVIPIHLWGHYEVCERLKKEESLGPFLNRLFLVQSEGEVLEWED